MIVSPSLKSAELSKIHVDFFLYTITIFLVFETAHGYLNESRMVVLIDVVNQVALILPINYWKCLRKSIM